MSDTTELRLIGSWLNYRHPTNMDNDGDHVIAAAAEIDRLRAEVERLSETIRRLGWDLPVNTSDDLCSSDVPVFTRHEDGTITTDDWTERPWYPVDAVIVRQMIDDHNELIAARAELDRLRAELATAYGVIGRRAIQDLLADARPVTTPDDLNRTTER